MPYALIPDGYSLKKVSKQEEDALKDLRKHEDFKTFLGSPQSGTAVGGLAIGVALLIFVIPMLKNFLKALASDDEFKGKTVTQIVQEEQDDPGGASFLRLYTAAFTGIPETLTAVVIPAPIQEEIKKQTGLDIGGIFSTLRGKL
jgi:hypothetical protein|tara:strand:+ start:56 stop:487 length:432 start_codon:yes stop_codon:yes gene_type:complete